MKTDLEIQKELSICLPFKFRINSETYDKRDECTYATFVGYLDNRTVSFRLNNVLGLANWSNKFYSVDGSTYCELNIWSEDKKQWVSKSDAGETSRDYLKEQYLYMLQNKPKFPEPKKEKETDKYPKKSNEEQEWNKALNAVKTQLSISSKGTASDSMKRAAVQLGLGAFLYSMESPLLKVDGWNIITKTGDKIYKYDNDLLNDYVNSICKLPSELKKEIKATTKEEQLVEIWNRMTNLQANQNLITFLAEQKKVILGEKTEAVK